jgi:hypothetical protein
MSELTRDSLLLARKEGYSDQEIGLHISEGRDDIKNAMEEGYSLDEIADHLYNKEVEKFNVKLKEQEEERQKDPSLKRIAAGLAADIALAEGAKIGGVALGSSIGAIIAAPTLEAAAPVTVPAGATIGYIAGALSGGVGGSIAAQKIEGATDIDWGRVAIDTALNLIPGSKIGKAGSKLSKVTGAIAKRPIASGAIIGAASTPIYMAVEEATGKENYDLVDYLKGSGTSMALGAGLGLAEKGAIASIRKIRNKTPNEINELIEAGDPATIELVDTLTAGLTPDELKMLTDNSKASVSEYIKNAIKSTASKVVPTRVIGYDATTAAKKAKASVEAVEGTATNIGGRIDSYLDTNPQYRGDAIAFLDGEDRPDLPPELLENLVFGRSKIRAEQQRMIDLHNSGEKLLPNNRVEVIEDSLNRGDYLTRGYEFFQNPNYTPSPEKYDALKRRLTTGLTDEMKDARMKEFIASYKMPREEAEAIRRFHGIRPGGEGKSNEAYQKDLKASSTPSKDRIAGFQKKLDEEKMTEEEANKYLAELQLKMKGNPTEFTAFMQGAGTPSVLKQRKVVSQELEDYLGLIKEPGQKVKSTISVLNRINEYNESDAKIAKSLFDSGMAVKASDPNFKQGLQPLKLKRGNAMFNGEELFVDPYTQNAINKVYAGGIEEQSNLLTQQLIKDVYETAVSGYKSAKVLGNISSYLIQVPSNFAATLGAGMNPALGLGNAVKMSLGTLGGTKLGGLPVIKKFANEAPLLTLQKFEDYKKRNMITGNIAYDDLKAGLQGKRFGKAFEKITNTPGRVYSLPDNIFRIVNYENNMHVLKNMMPTATDEQIKEMGARLTTKTYPNYNSLSPEVKVLSRAGIMPQFVSYSLEFIRTQIEHAKAIRDMMNGTLVANLGDEFKDIPVNQVAMKKEAAKRAIAMTTAYAAATYGIDQFNRQFFTEEEERAYRDTVAADFERNKPLLLSRKKDGSISSVNTSVYLPQTILANPVMAILRGENAEEGTSNLLNVLGNELIGEGSFAAQGLSTMVSGRDFESGELISNDPSYIGNRLDRASNFAKGFIPSTVTALQRPDKTTQEKVVRQLGIREEIRKIPEGFGFKARGIYEAVGNIKSTMSGYQYALKDGRVTPEQYEGLIANEQNNYAGNMQKMLDHVSNLKTLGETDETIIPMLRDAKFSSLDTLNLIDGKLVAFDPTKQKTTSEMLDEITGKNDSETNQNIRDFIKKDPIIGERILGAYKDRMRSQGIVLSPKEALIAGLPTNEKVVRLFPEIQSSRDPEAEIRRLLKKRILTKTDLKAIKTRQQSESN